MKYFAMLWLLLAGTAIYMYVNRVPYVEPVAPAGVDEKLWKRGRIMYKARCVTCHNMNPDLPGSVGPKLRGVSEELLRDRLTNGKGAMPPQKNMLRFVPAFREFLK